MNLFELQLGNPISTKKLSIQGERRVFDVYRVPIECLIYNKKNGRIATYVSKYTDDGNIFPESVVDFNNIIEGYIEQSNPEALKRTKANIKIMSQTEPAVVLSNGIVLDGNRRFTSLRQLSREGAGAEFNYLEAIILDQEKYTEKDIKRLELNLQHAIESRVDYNPIDRLVDIYRDLIENDGTFTIEEYQRETQLSVSEIRKEIEIAKLLVEYLEFINQSKRFYIARDQKVDGPLREIYKILNSKKIDEYDKDDIKDYLFTNILTLDGDVTRRIRELKMVFEDRKLREKLLEEVEEAQILDDATDFFIAESEFDEKLELDKKISEKVTQLTESFVEQKKLQNAKNKPLEILNRAYMIMSEIDRDSLARLDENSLTDFRNVIENVKLLVGELSDF
ncbi:TPA: ParB/RepB/Spo0J family partition protein [Streptococcus suis]|nr:ParB/RepB/Spo0J family partition protein [Streptococcus suis]